MDAFSEWRIRRKPATANRAEHIQVQAKWRSGRPFDFNRHMARVLEKSVYEAEEVEIKRYAKGVV